MRLRSHVPALAALALLALTGCGYVHIGRLPETPATVVGDEKLLKENGDLRLEKKMLQQELALTKSQGEALRAAIENRTADGDTSKRLTEKLNETTRELATLRANYAKLQTERAPGATPAELAALQSKLGATEEKLAGSLRNYTQLQDEIGQLRTEVDRTRTENVALTEKVKVVTAQNEQAQAALAQLNTDLLAQKADRTRIEQDAATLRTQLDTANSKISALAQQRTGAASDARALTASDADATGLRDQLETLRKKVWTLESERNELQQKLAATEAAAKNPGLAETKAREIEGQLTAALQSAKMLRDENDQLKAGAADLTKTKADLENELARTKSASLPLVAQAQNLRDQLRQTEAQAAALADENSRLKTRLAQSGGGNNNAPTSNVASANAPAPTTAIITPIAPTPRSGVTATFVASSSGQTSASRPAGQPLRFHTVTGGDTLSKISNLYYGTPSRWAEILVANRDILGDDNNLVVGRTLRIP